MIDELQSVRTRSSSYQHAEKVHNQQEAKPDIVRQQMKSSAKYAMLLLALCSVAISVAQNGANSVLQQHYDAAQKFQSSGDLVQAARQYRIFIADALDELGIERARLGEYEKAAPLFDEALRLAPNSPALEIEYARAAFAHGDFSRAATLAQLVIHDYPANTNATAKAHLILGRVLSKSNKGNEARQEFESAVALEPDFESGYALAIACLNMQDKPCAAKVFSEMQTAFGDTALIHRQFGLAYGNSDFQQDAINELQKSIALDGHLPGTHYALAAVYLSSSEGAKIAEAEEELHKELAVSPNDSLTYAALGHLEQGQHKYAEAERDLKRAIELNGENPDAYFYLGQLLFDTGRPAEAETALRHSIATTRDVSHNRYQVQKAHYLLGRILMQSGHADEAHKEMEASAALTKQSLTLDRDRLADYLADASANRSGDADSIGEKKSTPGTQNAAVSESSQQIDAFEKRLSPALADSYNNLGAIAASGKDFTSALTYFHRAAEWKPSLEGLDVNWGRAALSAGQFQDAVLPLSRALHAAPADTNVRSMLGISQYMVGDYAATLQTLQPMEAQINTIPQLDFIYAAAMVKAGNLNNGVDRLVALEKADPSIADVHRELAAAYEKAARPADAAREKQQYEALLAAKTTTPERR
ncbi:tetratricopeptide repeat protein [Acidobacterium sp. S8]|uniref:tetratricopeptide repeat protein n=1 Tax=Acidobacterium sp. S8 TaxID=1641854 RepID=UPI00131B319F|nr:tetratricopeptide repeat protein [Acidobacterium sp. S8]